MKLSFATQEKILISVLASVLVIVFIALFYIVANSSNLDNCENVKIRIVPMASATGQVNLIQLPYCAE